MGLWNKFQEKTVSVVVADGCIPFSEVSGNFRSFYGLLESFQVSLIVF